MPLTWDATKCEQTALNEAEYNFTAYLCFIMIPVGISQLTEDTLDEFHNRISLYESVFGNFYDEPISKERLALRVGYKANVGSLTRKQFMTSIEKRWFAESQY
jgi:hypothetical protein